MKSCRKDEKSYDNPPGFPSAWKPIGSYESSLGSHQIDYLTTGNEPKSVT